MTLVYVALLACIAFLIWSRTAPRETLPSTKVEDSYDYDDKPTRYRYLDALNVGDHVYHSEELKGIGIVRAVKSGWADVDFSDGTWSVHLDYLTLVHADSAAQKGEAK
jgi:hypothetical protein